MPTWTSLIENNDDGGWEDLISFRPPREVQSKVRNFQPVRTALINGLPPRIQHIENAYGKINLDYYPVKITQLPRHPVTRMRMSIAQLYHYMRLGISNNVLIDSDICEFSAFDADEAAIWTSANPTGAIIHIDMYKYVQVTVPGTDWTVRTNVNVDDGSVVVGYADENRWIFSTIEIEQDGLHPVSGNREFGYWQKESDQHIFYTRAADRVADLITSSTMSAEVFAGGHRLWLSFQNRVEAFVNHNGGTAQKLAPISNRKNWDSIKSKYFKPTTNWLYL